MKSNILYRLSLMTIALFVFGINAINAQKPKSINYYVNCSAVDGKLVKCPLTKKDLFDENGYLTKTISYREDGTVFKESLYNKKGLEVSSKFFDMEGKVSDYFLKDDEERFLESMVDGELKKFKLDANGRAQEMKIYNMEGKLLRYVTYTYNANGDPTVECTRNAADVIISKETWKYNTLGKLLTNSITSNGVTKMKAKNKYDAKGNLIEELSYDYYLGKVLEKKTYKYDANNNKIEEAFYDGQVVFNRTKYKYDSNKNVIEQSSYAANGQLNQKILFVYDANKNIIEESSYLADGTFDYKIINKYDANNNLIEMFHYEENDKLRFHKIYQFDANNNLMSAKEYFGDILMQDVVVKNGMKVKSVYNDKGEFFYVEIFFKNQYERYGNKIESEYDKNGNETVRSYFEKDGSVLYKEKFVYDAENQLVERQKFEGKPLEIVSGELREIEY